MSLFTKAVPLVAVVAVLFASCQKDPLPNENAVPKVDAGTYQSITVNTASLTGSATDTDGRVVAYLWSQVSGPSKAVFVNEGAASTTVKELKTGTYLFQLMATDNKGATGVDTVSVQVKLTPVTQTLTLQPGSNGNEYQLLNYRTSNFYTGAPDIVIASWTNGGEPYKVRTVVKYDLSSIPANATILSAKLFLYSYPAPTLNGNFNDANYGSGNGFFVKQITSSWTSSSITWSNEPVTAAANQVYVPHTNSSQLDLELDVKAAVSSMVANNANYGFYMKLENDVTYTCRLFVSSYNTVYPDKRPKLVITYQ